jgi:hypothetical protein
VLIDDKSIVEVTSLSIVKARAWADGLAAPDTPLNQREQTIAYQILRRSGRGSSSSWTWGWTT